MVDHGARAHSTWAASATARNVHCPGALALVPLAPPQSETIHSARGTAAHQVSEKCLQTGVDAITFLGDTEHTKEHDIEVDEEIVNSAQMYVDYVRGAIASSDFAIHWIEERFSLADLNPPFDAGGTGDAVIYYGDGRLLEIVDLKHGMGVVNANENPQLRTYALGAMLHHRGLDVDRVKVTIVQPRAPHRDGQIRSETFHVADLVEWTADLLASMHKSRLAIEERAAAGSNTVLLDEWAAKWLRPGACKFCPAEGFCPALKKRAIDAREGIAKLYFEDAGPVVKNTPETMSPEELAQTLDALELVEDWIKAVRGYAHARVENGDEIPGYHLADKIGNRKWAADDAKVAGDLKAVCKLTDDDIFEVPKLKSVAQIEKVLGVKRKAEIENMFHRPITGKNLVSASKSTRPPAKTVADKYFEKN